MKRRIVSIVIGSVVFLVGCGKNEIVTEMSETIIEVEVEEETNSLIEQEEITSEEQSADSGESKEYSKLNETLGKFDSTAQAYEALLNYMLNHEVEIGIDGWAPSYLSVINNNKFAITDIDKDGIDELIIDWTNPSAMVGYTSYCFQYDVKTDTWTNEFESGGEITIYDNGVILFDAAHNQGYGEMWPYDITKYDATVDKYVYYGWVDSEDKSGHIAIWGDADLYPEKYDTDGYGTVYSISAEELGYTYGENYDNYYSKTEYDEFRKKLIGDAKEVNIIFSYICKEELLRNK